MKLTSALSADFDSAVRSRGANYYRSGAVLIRAGSLRKVEARVRGSRIYDVEISWDGRTLTLFCDCPFFESGDPCKHLWATMLASDAKDYFGPMTRFNSRSVIYDVPKPYLEPPASTHDEEEDPPPERPGRNSAHSPYLIERPPAPPTPPVWKQRLQEVIPAKPAHESPWPEDREFLYQVDLGASAGHSALVINLGLREPKRGGGWKVLTSLRLNRGDIARVPNPVDRKILGLLSGCGNRHEWVSPVYDPLPVSYRLLDAFALAAMPVIAGSGRCTLFSHNRDEEPQPLLWDDGEAWRFSLRLVRDQGGQCAITGWLKRGEQQMNITAPALVSSGLVFTKRSVARLEEAAPLEWIQTLRRVHRIEAPETELEAVMMAMIEHPVGVPFEVPDDLQFEEVAITPRPALTIRTRQRHSWEREQIHAELSFDYDGRRIPDTQTGRGVFDSVARRYMLRDKAAEADAKSQLRDLGLAYTPPDWREEPAGYRLSDRLLPSVVRACLEHGWHIEADGKVFQRPGAMRVRVASGVDWFELHGEVDYGGNTAKLPALLAALKRGDGMVRLDDGTYGLLPEEWLARFGSFAKLGTAESDHLRFRRNQTGVLDALLAAQPEVNCDETFAKVRSELSCFGGIGALEQPAGFVGQLREYQREGLGWMEFLRRFSFGGCLADDMGVGKTAQVLAVLEARRALRATPKGKAIAKDIPTGPSLVVVPKSLVFNWKQEAARFTPQLRVLDHTGLMRDVAGFGDYDVILTTYGTLRRDAAEFKDLEFDYIVLDEAQAIKNANTEASKAARLLRGRYRLALSGTPVENHLGELWSIFEFLNPGMLGAAGVLKLAGSAGRSPSEETRQLLAHALRPFILRRTKEQVVRELPPKAEQTIFCELDGPQRKLYDELRAHYRHSLLKTVATQGLAKSKILVLEALLRLRQAACHPGLLDPKRRNDPSAKLDVLTDRLSEIVQDGHKALVFSQFTSLLSIVRERLDEMGLVYEYLDGATRDRQSHVERFQTDPDCGLFLISLKAGGLGLNLTSAGYVFLLDPWWNPAVEAQAVDRAHRIGQTQQVFAYRLIARDTVEEKVLQLQNSKRELAAAIISEDNSLIKNLQREDLELLLS